MTKGIVRTVGDLPEGHWMRNAADDDVSLRGYAEDRAVSVLTTQVAKAIADAGIPRQEVARLLGTTKSYVSQVLNGSTNMTLKTLGALLWVSGQQVDELLTEPVGTEERSNLILMHVDIATTEAADDRYYPGPFPWAQQMRVTGLSYT